MKIQKIIVSDFKEAFDVLGQNISARAVNLDEKHFVIVPDKYTLSVERLLFGGKYGSGAFDVEVLTLNRLFSKMVKVDSYLPRHGAIMLLKKVIEKNSKELKCFKKSANFTGFAEKLYDTIKVLTSCRVTPNDLKSDGAFGLKLGDIKLIYEKYLLETKGRYVDAIGRMELLLTEVAKLDFGNVHFYFAGQDSFTKQEEEIIEILSDSSMSSRVYEVASPNGTFNEVEFYSALDIYDQLKHAAKKIRQNAVNGIRYDDMCIISPSLAFEETKRILSEFDIPFYIDKKLALFEQPLAKLFKQFLSVTENGYKRTDFIELTKNFYLDISKEDSNAFENYCNKYCIDYLGFFTPFNKGTALEITRAESVRSKLVQQIKFFEKKYDCANNANSFLDLVKSMLERFNLTEKTDELSKIANLDLSSINQKILKTAELLNEIVGDNKLGKEELFELFFEGLSAARIALIPKLTDVVAVGEASAFKAREYKEIFVIGFCDGEIPPLKADYAIISDSEIDSLKALNILLEPKVTDINEKNSNDLLYALMGNAMLTLCYTSGGDKRISQLASFIKSRSKKVIINSAADEMSLLYDNNKYRQFMVDDNYLNLIAKNCSSVGNALEMLLVSRSKVNNGESGLPFESSIFEVLNKNAIEKYFDYSAESKPFLENKADIFFFDNTTSISKIQTYFLCPYRNFLENALRLTPREDGNLSPLDIGNFLHKAIENFVRENDFNDIDTDMRQIVDRLSTGELKYALEANKGLVELVADEAVKIAHIIASQITAGQYKSYGLEIRFGDDSKDKLKTIKVCANDKEISLCGVIDRVDNFNEYARVIDYKTGKKSGAVFSFTDLYYGVKIQLAIYMKILEESGFEPGGMFYFPFSASWKDNEFTHRLSGVYNSHEELMLAMDTNLSSPKYSSQVFNARRLAGSTEFNFADSNFAQSSDNLKMLTSYGFNILQTAVIEIIDGYIKPSPLEGACSYCAYKAICKKSMDAGKSRKKITATPDFIIESMKGGGEQI